MFTLGNWICMALLFILTIAITVMFGMDDFKSGMIAFLVSMLLVFVVAMIILWYNSNTASGRRAVKDFQSNINNGIDREITITSEDGREIFHYEGKVDIESNHTDNYIKFESEEGKRYIIYYGIQDTIKIIEK